MTPSGIDIAHWAVEAHNARLFHQSCDPLKYDERNRAWCVIYMDMDYEQGFLFEIYSTNDAGFEVCDFLAVWDHHGEDARALDVEWFNDPRLFFDGDGERHERACKWFIGWLHDIKTDRSRRWAEANPDLAASTAAYNAKHRAKRHQEARAAGLQLPYLMEANNGSDA